MSSSSRKGGHISSLCSSLDCLVKYVSVHQSLNLLKHVLFWQSRVVQLAHGERSYHIFYQLCAGAPSALRGLYLDFEPFIVISFCYLF